jgi:hypothetical protein
MSFLYSQTFDFIRNFLESSRKNEAVYDSVLKTFRELLMGMLIPPGEWLAYNYGAQLQVISYLSLPILLAILSGYWLTRKKVNWKTKSLFWCGAVPTLIALYLSLNTRIHFKIPFLKSMDINRVLWFSMPFCFVYMGYFISYFKNMRFVLGGTLLSFLFLKLMPETSELPTFYYIQFSLLFLGALVLLKEKRWGRYLILFSILLSPTPTIIRILGSNIKSCAGTQYSDDLKSSGFRPSEFIPLMKKGNRLATEFHTHKGQDLRSAQYGILGSNARAIVVDRKFGTFLEEKKLVTVDQVPYGYFFSRPWQTDELSKLGIRYLLVNKSPDTELQKLGWINLGHFENLNLYENPQKPTPLFQTLKGQSTPLFLSNYTFSGNHLQAELLKTKNPSTLTVTLLNRSGYQAKIDGKNTEIKTAPNGFMLFDIAPSDQTLEIIHAPYTRFSILLGMLLSTVLCLFYGWFLSRSRVG